MVCFGTCPFLGSWRALLCEEVHVRAGRGCSAFFEGSMTGYSLTEILYEQNVMPYTALQIADSQARPALNTPCQDEGMSSRTTRGYWKLGAIGCRGASWSKELDDKEPHGAPTRV